MICVGYVQLNGKTQKLWFWRELGNPQHESEISEIGTHMKVEDILRFDRIHPDYRKTYAPDAVILVNGHTFFWEHDRATERTEQIKAKMLKLSDCPFDVLWTVEDEARMTELVFLAPNDRHWFTTYKQAAELPHGKIWMNKNGEWETLESTDRSSVVQVVQLGENGEPHAV